jgi:hypothetical protein
VSPRVTGTNLAAAALFFWLAWWRMPAVGITDTREIFEQVAAHRGAVSASARIQLISTLLYVAACVGVLRLPQAERPAVRGGAAMLLLGAAGSTADAVIHLLAYEMTAPGVDRAAMIPVMERRQGPNLALLGPLIAAFFLGSLLLAIGSARNCASQAWLGVSLARGARS